MLADVKWLREKYNYFNDLLWEGQLPSISFNISNSERVWGYARYRFDLWNDMVTPVSITISNKYDSPENVKINVLLHEMIHIADYSFHPEHFVRNGKKISKRYYDAHGSVFFLPEMRRVNAVVADMGYVVNPNVTQEEVNASELSDANKERLKRKTDAGTRVFISTLRKHEKGGDYTYAYCQAPMYEKWLRYIEGDDWWKATYSKTDEYITNGEKEAMKKTTRRGLSYYIKNNDVEGFIQRHSLRFVKTVYIDKKNFPNGDVNIGTPVDISKPIAYNKPTEQPKPQEERIPVFRFQTMQGNIIEFKNLTKEELKVKLKERFPKWSEEAIDRAINNPKYYPLKESKNMEKKTLNEEQLRNYVKKLVKEQIEQMNYNSSMVPGMRRSKVKQIDSHTFEESIE